MEDILKEIIQIDKNAREIVKDEKEKKLNIDDFVESEFKTQKTILDLEYKEEVIKQKEKYNKLFEQKKIEIDKKVKQKVEEIEKSYKEKEEDIVKYIINSIKNGGGLNG